MMMIVLLILLFFVLVFLGFLMNKIGVLVICDPEELEIHLRLWVLSIPIYPERKKGPWRRRKKQKKEKKRKKEGGRKKKFWERLEPKIRVQVNYRFVWRLIKSLLPVLLNGLHKLKGKIRVDELEVNLVWAEEDPAAAAIHYGTMCALAGSFLPVLANHVILNRKKIDLSVDFQRETPLWFVRCRVSITLAQLLYIGLYTGIEALKTFLRVRKKGKEINNGKETSGK